MKRIALVIASLTLSGGLALAQSPEKMAEHWFNQGNTAYNLGRFDEAVGHFTKAYEAWPQPEFLYNIAQSYRLAGNCKQALHFYKRFKSLKEKDDKAPLSAKKREEVERFINELTDCAAKADSTAGAQPDTIDRPPPGPTGPTTTGTGPATATGSPATGTTITAPTAVTSVVGATSTSATGGPGPTGATGPTVGALESPDGDDGDGGSVHATQQTSGPSLVSARMTAGIALLGAGDLEMPVLPSLGITGGYPLPIGPLTLELGAGLTYTPLPYEVGGAQQRGTMLGVRAVAAAVYPVANNLSLRGELGVGIVSLSGLGEGNPISSMRQAQSFTLPSVRFGVAVDYAVTPNLFAYASPFSIAFSPGTDDMYAGNLREIDVLFGVGYRQ
jgi:hypothetical protein